MKVKINDSVTAEIVRNASIRMRGEYCGRTFDKTFQLGDFAEYNSYNLSYFGPIVGITDKTVTIQEKYGSTPRRHRLKLHEFMWRNYNFDYLVKAAENAETSMYI